MCRGNFEMIKSDIWKNHLNLPSWPDIWWQFGGAGVNWEFLTTFVSNKPGLWIIDWLMIVEYWIHLNETNSDVHMYTLIIYFIRWRTCSCSSTYCTSGMRWTDDMEFTFGLYTLVWIDRRRHEKLSDGLLQQKVTIAFNWIWDSNTWDSHSRILNELHTYELGIVSMGKFIDTLPLSHSLLAGETVNCCQHIPSLWLHVVAIGR